LDASDFIFETGFPLTIMIAFVLPGFFDVVLLLIAIVYERNYLHITMTR